MNNNPRMLLVALAAPVIFGTLSACGSTEASLETSAREGSSAPSPSGSTTDDGAEPTAEYDTEFAVAEPVISDDATERFGPDGAAEGTRSAVDISVDNFCSDGSITAAASQKSAEKYAYPVLDHMTDTAADYWRDTVEKHIADAKGGDTAAETINDIFSIMFYAGISGEGTDVGTGVTVVSNPNGPVIVNPVLTSVRAGSPDGDLLPVSIEGSCDLRVLAEGTPKLWNLTRDLTYYMLEQDGEWLIDGWSGTWGKSDTFPKDKGPQ